MTNSKYYCFHNGKGYCALTFPDSREVENNHYTLFLFSWQLLKATVIKIVGYVGYGLTPYGHLKILVRSFL